MAEAPEIDTYRSVEVCRLAGCSYRAFDYWCRCGVFGHNGGAAGSGSRRHGFTNADVTLARALWRLSEAGVLGGGARSGGDPRPMTRFVPSIRAAIERGNDHATIRLALSVSVTVWLDDLRET